MRGPPAAGPVTQGASGDNPGPGRNPKWARIINQVRNQSPVIRRKTACLLVKLGRAVWVSDDQIRLNMEAQENRRDLADAAKDYCPSGRAFTAQELLNMGVALPHKALDESVLIRPPTGHSRKPPPFVRHRVVSLPFVSEKRFV
jgi:hypothetical protein